MTLFHYQVTCNCCSLLYVFEVCRESPFAFLRMAHRPVKYLPRTKKSEGNSRACLENFTFLFVLFALMGLLLSF